MKIVWLFPYIGSSTWEETDKNQRRLNTLIEAIYYILYLFLLRTLNDTVSVQVVRDCCCS